MLLRVLGRRSSINVRKVLWTCDELGVGYTHEELGRDPAELRTSQFLALNPNGLVPVLIDGDAVLWESNTIVRYLAAKHARVDLLPDTPLARAAVEQWMDWQATELNESWRYAFLALVRRAAGYDDPVRIAESTARWNAMMVVLDAQLARTGAHVAGDQLTTADIVIGLSLHRWRCTPMVRPELTHVRHYEARLRARAAFARHAQADVP